MSDTSNPEARERERRRRLAKVFGDVLPETTGDDRSESWGEQDPGPRDDEWYREETPPHHG